MSYSLAHRWRREAVPAACGARPSLKQPYLGCDVLAAEGARGDLVPAVVAGLVATLESKPPGSLHAHCAALALRTCLRLILCYAALQHHLAHSLGAGFKRACNSSSSSSSRIAMKQEYQNLHAALDDKQRSTWHCTGCRHGSTTSHPHNAVRFCNTATKQLQNHHGLSVPACRHRRTYKH